FRLSPNVLGWLVRYPTRARVPRSRSRARKARSSVTLLRKTAASQPVRVTPTRRFTMSYAGSSGLNVNNVSVSGPPMVFPGEVCWNVDKSTVPNGQLGVFDG